jgi:hypothetical protein
MPSDQRKPTAGWSACKQAVSKWPRPGLIALVQELYRLSDDNRRFLQARLLPKQTEQAMQAAERKLRQIVSKSSVFSNRFRHADMKRVVDQFQKASDNITAVARLLLVDLDASLETFSEVGNDELLADHVLASIERLHGCLERIDAEDEWRVPIVERLTKLGSRWSKSFGYGVSDELYGLAQEWAERVRLS